ncbi:hypothetical protein DPSP01_014322 [Paraphaeosphaeria sporulosa]
MTRVAVLEGDQVDYALGWNLYRKPQQRYAVVNSAHDRYPGGDWQTNLVAPEECFARRSNLAQAMPEKYYPLSPYGGIFCPEVYVFRSGPNHDYAFYEKIQTLPVISVAPVRAPKLKEGSYAFEQERQFMEEKMKTVLRIAAYHNQRGLFIGAFGLGPSEKNPPREVAKMWRHIIYEEEEFQGTFDNVIFVIDSGVLGDSSCTDAFKEELAPSRICPIRYIS